MSVRSDREKSKMQEKYQLILAQMLKEDDNRFCADCDTKSPRWASWNIGIFICIRCAGFHRNLGVHISKVRSVNLDSWTAEQIASMQAMGNNKARAVYEANLPTGFRRPQADSALESFIRAKYEQRKWIAKEWIPPEITVSSDLIESETHQRRCDTSNETNQGEKSAQNFNIPKPKVFAPPETSTNPVRQTVNNNQTKPIPSSQSTTSISNPPPVSTPVVNQNSIDLLGLDLDDSTIKPTNTIDNSLQVLFTTPTTTPTINTNNSATATMDDDLEKAFSTSNEPTNTNNIMTNDKIMALFNTPSSSTGNIRPVAPMQIQNMNPTGFGQQPPIPQQQHSHLLPHQKSASYGGNLYQQTTTNQFAIRPNLQPQGFPTAIRPGMNTMFPNNISSPTLQNPPSAFTPDQLTNQFSQFVPFANSKTNTSASALISGMPTRPVTECMPASSDLLWQ